MVLSLKGLYIMYGSIKGSSLFYIIFNRMQKLSTQRYFREGPKAFLLCHPFKESFRGVFIFKSVWDSADKVFIMVHNGLKAVSHIQLLIPNHSISYFTAS